MSNKYRIVVVIMKVKLCIVKRLDSGAPGKNISMELGVKKSIIDHWEKNQANIDKWCKNQAIENGIKMKKYAKKESFFSLGGFIFFIFEAPEKCIAIKKIIR